MSSTCPRFISSIPTRRWRSFKIESHLFRAASLSFPFLTAVWFWAGPLWRFGSLGLASGLVGVVALASGRLSLLWFLPAFLGFCAILQACLKRWGTALQAARIGEEHLSEEINTLEGELGHLEEVSVGLLERLNRYQKLQQISNAFSASLSPDELIQWISGVTGEIIRGADLVLLYLVDPKNLVLELKSVWRRAGNLSIKTKTGDPFDLWVMRQGQPLLVEEPSADFRFPEGSAQRLGRPLGSLVAVPLLSEIRSLGVLRVESASPPPLGAEELRLVRIIGDLASLALENSRLFQRMEELAITDDLTGLFVRKHFQKRLEEEIARARNLKAPLSLLLIDIDRFKGYNDTFGHSAGDKLLKQLAQMLIRMLRVGEVAARFGGEEFVCLLPGVEAAEAAEQAEAIRRQVEDTPIELRRSLTRSSVSIGVAGFPQDGWAGEELLQAADQRLYRAKASGRNRVCSS
ncbi:MAG: sensor domain-containing diguanylate cyclase [Candidatus Omnitrophica bacterium]|nr:sensor domain-containing diguanylate cyclase [Candidatus Omnitrophota bacterium]